jgi:hypothetical protein
MEPGIIQVVSPLSGALLLALLLADIFTTVFKPEGRGGPINRVQNGLVWRAFRAVGERGDGTVRRTLLSYCGPLLAVLTIVVWALVLIGGFALIYFPFLETSFTYPYGRSGPPWVVSVYYSGYIASTLGSGEVVPTGVGMRLLTALQAVLGFALFAMSVAYILAVYQQLGTATALAIDVFGYFRRGVDGILEEARSGGGESLHQWVDLTTRQLLRVTQAYSQYPIIGYFHPRDYTHSLTVQVGNLLALLRATQEPSAALPPRDADRHPSLLALETAVAAYIESINRDVVPRMFEPGERQDEPVALERSHERFLRYMLYPTPARPEGRD